MHHHRRRTSPSPATLPAEVHARWGVLPARTPGLVVASSFLHLNTAFSPGRPVATRPPDVCGPDGEGWVVDSGHVFSSSRSTASFGWVQDHAYGNNRRLRVDCAASIVPQDHPEDAT